MQNVAYVRWKTSSNEKMHQQSRHGAADVIRGNVEQLRPNGDSHLLKMNAYCRNQSAGRTSS